MICPKCGFQTEYRLCPGEWLSPMSKGLDGYRFANLGDITPMREKRLKDYKAPILFVGPSGSGKTHMAIALSKALSGSVYLIANIPNLPSEYSYMMDSCLSQKSLILDEIDNSFLDLIIQYSATGRILIATANLSQENLGSLDERLLNRFEKFTVNDACRHGTASTIEHKRQQHIELERWTKHSCEKCGGSGRDYVKVVNKNKKSLVARLCSCSEHYRG